MSSYGIYNNDVIDLLSMKHLIVTPSFTRRGYILPLLTHQKQQDENFFAQTLASVLSHQYINKYIIVLMLLNLVLQKQVIFFVNLN